MNKIKILGLILAILFGMFVFVYGGYDDSPGSQGLGLLIVGGAIFYIVKSKSPGTAIDIELTLNRWGLGRIAENKFQFLCFRFSKWKIVNKYSISFEINWRVREGDSPKN